MKRLFFFGLSIISIVSMTSCSPADKYEAELAEIDSCMTVLDSIELTVNGIDFDSLIYMVDKVKANEDSIAKYYKPDTLSLEVGIRMNECKGIRKSLKNLEFKEQEYMTEVEALRTQFTNLRTDIENGVLEEEKVKGYLEEEKAALNVLNLTVSDFYTLQELEKAYFYHSVPFVDDLIIQWRERAESE